MTYQGLIHRYRQYLDLPAHTQTVSLNEGNTPLIPMPRLGREFGCELFVKFEGLNPTGSFKDRGMTAAISEAVIRIRSSKLPDPAVIGNCGSFFKNPETDRAVLERIQKTHPNAPHYPLPDGRVKIPAGWLIEQCGWKGKRVGNTGSYEKQALVLVNYGGATGQEVKALALAIIESVEKSFGVRLEAEVNMI